MNNPRLKEDVVMLSEDGFVALLNERADEIHILNESGAYIVGLCDGKHTTADIVDGVLSTFEPVPGRDEVVRDVLSTLSVLEEKQVLDGPVAA